MSPKRSDDKEQQTNKRAHIGRAAWLLAAFAVFVYLMYIAYLVLR